MKTKITTFFICFVICLTGQVSFSQITSSSISGKVLDGSGETLPGATIEVYNSSTGTRYATSTNMDGRYTIVNMNPGGPYAIEVSFMGFQTFIEENVRLTLGSSVYNFVLEEETNSLDEIVVTARGNNRNKGVANRIGEEQLKDMPAISRSLQDYTRTTPQSSNNSFLGTNYRYNNVTLDGAINNDAIGFSPSLGGQSSTSGQPGSSTRTNPVSIDAIQDIQVYLAPYDVKIGNFLGGSINAVTRSGTNEVEGSVYGFGRNAAITGKNKAGDNNKMPSSFHEYQTGFRLGLPIIKDKLFFFTNEEITRRQDPIILAAGSKDNKIITEDEAKSISDYFQNRYGLNAGSYGNYNVNSQSNKFFNRLDWNINENHHLSLRNNTITSKATNLERDQQNFRFGSIDFEQINNQTSTVLELKSRFDNDMSNSLIVGYSNVHDYRKPSTNAEIPQIEIGSRGGTIFLGTDREASIFDMKQKTWEITNNFTWIKNNHTFTIGTHNEFYKITYGFVNAWNGRINYASIDDFLNNRPSRVRTNFNYKDNTRKYIQNNPPAEFRVNMYSFYVQDDIQIGDKLKLSPGIRFDIASMPDKPALSTKTTEAPVDPNYGQTYTYTKPRDINNKYLGKVQVSPRIGFSYDVKGDQSLVLRGGTGVFTGRIPFAWLGYAYYNNGDSYGAFDQRYDYKNNKPAEGSDPIADALTGNGEAGYVANQGVDVNDASGKTQVDLIDNNFKMPQVWRSSLAIDYKTDNQWRFSIEGIYTSVIYDLKFQHVNLADNAIYMPYDKGKQQPIYIPKNGTRAINPKYTNAYLLTNTKKGYRYNITAQVGKSFPFGLDFNFAYTYGQSKDITNGIRNSMESNWQLNQALNPNEPGLAYSNFDIRHNFVVTTNYRYDWNQDTKNVTNVSLFFNATSGLPYTLGMIRSNINGSAQQQSLLYVPNKGETASFFADTDKGRAQAAEFDQYIDGDSYLKKRRGKFTERNGARTPWNVKADMRITHDFNFNTKKGKTNTVTFTYDIINVTNLLNKNWGIQYFAPNTYNSTSSMGLKLEQAGTETSNPIYSFNKNNVTDYSKDFFASRWQMQFGLRYSF